MRVFPALLLLATTARAATAQTEDQLRSYFEGRSVVARIEMPGSDDGVDVYPGTSQPIDFPRHASRLKRFGTAVHRGDELLITKVKVKKDLIEFQLGGGGYGTFGDDASPDVSVPSAPRTEREKNLEKDVKHQSDPAKLRAMREELDALRKDREREDAHNQAAAAEASQIKEANIRQRRLEGGSRFNLRYKPVVPGSALTAESVMRALAEYVDFSPMAGGQVAQGGNPLQGAQGGLVPVGSTDDLKKGMLADVVDNMLGRPESISQRKEGTLSVSTSIYHTRDRRVAAEFVEGVLIRFTISSP
ncbi:MAG: hypothetical protein ABI765_05590 [Gemmatimonadota bacterium]